MNHIAYFPVQIVFRNVSHSQTIEANARKHAEKLGKFFDRIMSCQIIIDTHRHQNKGRIFHVSIDLVVPKTTLVVNRDLAENHAHEDVYVAIRDAFLAMKHQLQHYVDKQHGAIKHHVSPLEGRVLEIAPLADYGFIETIDGRRIRFSSKSVIDYDFNKLEVGKRVTFVEAKSNDGMAASTVYVK